MTSALSRLAAASNEIRVRVESSKKRLTTVRPRRVGSFLIGRSARDRSSAAVSRISRASSRVRSALDSRWVFIRPPPSGARRRRSARRRCRRRSPARRDVDGLGQRGGEVLAHEVGADGELAVAAVDEDGELDRSRPPDVVERVERRPNRASAEEDVVDEHHDRAVDPAGGDVGALERAGRLSRRSSRYIVMSSEPDGTSTPSTAAMVSAMRRARGTPRLGIPSRIRSSDPLFRSRISWAIRVKARDMSGESRTTREVAVSRRLR